MKNIVILISGRGSNMEALIAARDAGSLPVNIAAVISNRPDAQGLEFLEGLAGALLGEPGLRGLLLGGGKLFLLELPDLGGAFPRDPGIGAVVGAAIWTRVRGREVPEAGVALSRRQVLAVLCDLGRLDTISLALE